MHVVINSHPAWPTLQLGFVPLLANIKSHLNDPSFIELIYIALCFVISESEPSEFWIFISYFFDFKFTIAHSSVIIH